MPLYEYECFVCGNRFEKIQKVSADPIKVCPECGGSVRRLLGVPALQFKGSGWYVTDYGKGNGQSPAEQSRTAEHEAGSQGEGSAQSEGGGAKDSESSKKVVKESKAS